MNKCSIESSYKRAIQNRVWFLSAELTVTKRLGQHDVSSTCRLLWIFVSRRQEVLQLREIAFAVSRTSQPVQFVHSLVAMYPSSLCVSVRPKYLYVSVLLESCSVKILIFQITVFPNEFYYNDGNHILID